MKHLQCDVFRLAGTYLIIIMVMSLGFSVIFYNASIRELERRPHNLDPTQVLVVPTGGSKSFDDYLTQRTEESRQALLIDLVIINALALVVGGFLSFLLAERTLRPIEENLEAQAQFVSDASHELRTPLTALRTANEVALRNTRLKIKEARQVIADNVEDIARLQDLADSMLGLLREQETSYYQGEVSLSHSVGDAMGIVVAQALAKNIAVDDQTRDYTIRGSAQGLVQLITIILDNAIKYSGPDTTITISSERRGKYAALLIADQGVGMDQRTLTQIFTRFYRAEKSRTTSGYGLGLAIAKKIVHGHGGKISATSTLGEGTIFSILLPLAHETR